MPDFKYRQLADKLTAEIFSSYSTPGSRLPTEDELQERYGVSRNTVRQAVTELVERGILVKNQGRGTFVSERINEFIEKKRNGVKSRSIGVIMNQVNAYVFPYLLMGISDYLLKHNYNMLLRMTFNRVANEKKVLEELLVSDIAGLLVEPACSSLPLVNGGLYRRVEQTIPCVLLYTSLPGFSFPSVDIPNAEGFEMLVTHLVKHGHRDIAAILKFDEQPGTGRYQGLVAGLNRHGLDLDQRQILWYGDEDFEILFSDQNAPRVLRAIKNCTAIMCFNDDVAARLLPFLDKHGLSVPDDISVVGYDDLWTTSEYSPVTTIRNPRENLGKAAAKAILDLLENPFADVSYKFPPMFVDHGSVSEVRPKAATARLV